MVETPDLLDRVFNSVEDLVCGKVETDEYSSPVKMKNLENADTTSPSKATTATAPPAEYSSNIQSGEKVLIFNEETFSFYLGEPSIRCCFGQEQPSDAEI